MEISQKFKDEVKFLCLSIPLFIFYLSAFIVALTIGFSFFDILPVYFILIFCFIASFFVSSFAFYKYATTQNKAQFWLYYVSIVLVFSATVYIIARI